MKVIITRPQIDAQSMAAQIETLGLVPVVAPLMTVKLLSGPPLELDAYQAVIATSANGVRALSKRVTIRDIRFFAVGSATALLAKELKFTEVVEADGDVMSLAETICRHTRPGDRPMLHVAGSIVAGDLAGKLAQSGYKVDRAVLYEAEAATTIPQQLAKCLASDMDDTIAFFSPRTARIFVQLASDAALLEGCRDKTAICLSDAVAEPLRPYFQRLRVASVRSTSSMMDLIKEEGLKRA